MTCLCVQPEVSTDITQLGTDESYSIIAQARRDTEKNMYADLDALRKIPLFSKLDDEQLLKIYSDCEVRTHAANEDLADASGQGFSIITQGAAKLVASGDSGEIGLRLACAGDCLHELGLCDCCGNIRARALGAVRTLNIDSSVISDLAVEYPEETHAFFNQIRGEANQAIDAVKQLAIGKLAVEVGDLKDHLGILAIGVGAEGVGRAIQVSQRSGQTDNVLSAAEESDYDMRQAEAAEVLELELVIDDLRPENSFLHISDMAELEEDPLDGEARAKEKETKQKRESRRKKKRPETLFFELGESEPFHALDQKPEPSRN